MRRSVRPGKDRERTFLFGKSKIRRHSEGAGAQNRRQQAAGCNGVRKALQRKFSLKKNAQFKFVFRKGKSGGSHEAVLLYVRSNTLKVGFSVGKKIGCAVQRNRVKRRLREAVSPLLPRMKQGLYIFIAREPAATAGFDQLCRSMQYLLRRQNLLLPAVTEPVKESGDSK